MPPCTNAIDTPSTPDDIDRNPEGLFVIDFDWRKPPEQGAACRTNSAAAQP